jgi:hypothetical protein
MPYTCAWISPAALTFQLNTGEGMAFEISPVAAAGLGGPVPCAAEDVASAGYRCV